MKVDVKHLGINIDSPLITAFTSNSRPPTWPPPRNFPVVIDADGQVVSRFGDARWNLAPWARRPTVVNFGDGRQRRGVPSISRPNADVLRLIAGWWLWGPQAVRVAGTLNAQVRNLRPIFILCTEEGICVTDLMRYPAVADKLPEVISSGLAGSVLNLLHNLFEHRQLLGFTLLDMEGLRRLEARLPDHEGRQTPYIPSRIWLYQVNRLREFLDDFLAHELKLRHFFRYCLAEYTRRYGSASVERGRCRSKRGPFAPRHRKDDPERLRIFAQAAWRFGVSDLLARWCCPPGEPLRGIHVLTYYFTMATRVGLAYLLNFSLMRVEEGWSLHTDCLQVEDDDQYGQIYLLRGTTTKTVHDDDARWVTSPSAKVAVDVMTIVSRLRLSAAQGNPDVPKDAEYVRNPHLAVRPYEPWVSAEFTKQHFTLRPTYPSYGDMIKSFPQLFDSEQLRITEEDLEMARLITPSLDANVFGVGKTWPLTWHQLRRTGAVNMQASGLVSDAAVQYQLKHATRAMSLYYGQGYSRVRLNACARTEFLRTMYELVGKEVSRLFSNRYVSPYGENRKMDILRAVSPEDGKKLSTAAREGRVSWRETLLGGCTKRGPCEYGGIDSVARCGGGDGRAPCADALFDRSREPAVQHLKKVIASRLVDATEGSPYHESLLAQLRAVENTLNVIADES